MEVLVNMTKVQHWFKTIQPLGFTLNVKDPVTLPISSLQSMLVWQPITAGLEL